MCVSGGDEGTARPNPNPIESTAIGFPPFSLFSIRDIGSGKTNPHDKRRTHQLRPQDLRFLRSVEASSFSRSPLTFWHVGLNWTIPKGELFKHDHREYDGAECGIPFLEVEAEQHEH